VAHTRSAPQRNRTQTLMFRNRGGTPQSETNTFSRFVGVIPGNSSIDLPVGCTHDRLRANGFPVG
jgi:hypothetical protein